MTQTNDASRVLIFDTTLRDGEQSPGATMSHEEKLEIAALLDEMGVDIIEAGFPIASPGDFEAVSTIAKETKGIAVAGLARCKDGDPQRGVEALLPAGATVAVLVGGFLLLAGWLRLGFLADFLSESVLLGFIS